MACLTCSVVQLALFGTCAGRRELLRPQPFMVRPASHKPPLPPAVRPGAGGGFKSPAGSVPHTEEEYSEDFAASERSGESAGTCLKCTHACWCAASSTLRFAHFLCFACFAYGGALSLTQSVIRGTCGDVSLLSPCAAARCRPGARPAGAPAALRLPPAARQRAGHRGGVRRGRGGGRGRHDANVPWRLD